MYRWPGHYVYVAWEQCIGGLGTMYRWPGDNV